MLDVLEGASAILADRAQPRFSGVKVCFQSAIESPSFRKRALHFLEASPIERQHGNAVERGWLYLCGRYLSHRLLADYEAVIEACCRAWNALAAEIGRIKSLCAYPHLEKIIV